jgi:hypothetical protein
MAFSLFLDCLKLPVEHSEILALLEGWAYAGLINRQGGSDALEYSVIASDIEVVGLLSRRMPSLPAAQGSQSVHPQTHLIRTQL